MVKKRRGEFPPFLLIFYNMRIEQLASAREAAKDAAIKLSEQMGEISVADVVEKVSQSFGELSMYSLKGICQAAVLELVRRGKMVKTWRKYCLKGCKKPPVTPKPPSVPKRKLPLDAPKGNSCTNVKETKEVEKFTHIVYVRPPGPRELEPTELIRMHNMIANIIKKLATCSRSMHKADIVAQVYLSSYGDVSDRVIDKVVETEIMNYMQRDSWVIRLGDHFTIRHAQRRLALEAVIDPKGIE